MRIYFFHKKKFKCHYSGDGSGQGQHDYTTNNFYLSFMIRVLLLLLIHCDS